MSEETENTPLINNENEEIKEQSNYLTIPNNNNDLYSYDDLDNINKSDALSIYDEKDMLFFVKYKPENHTLKSRIGRILNTTKWNITILLMIACDIFIVVLELFVQLDEKKQCNLPGSPPPQYSAGHEKFVSFVHHLGLVSDIFLCVFTTEVILHLYCFGYKYLFEAWINFVDSLTVMITFAVTIFITFYSASDEAQNFVDILIILRFWRIFCLIESVVNATQMEANLRFQEVLTDLNAEVRILKNRKDCYAEKLIELGYDLSKLENDYLYPKEGIVKENEDGDIILEVPSSYDKEE